MPHRYFHVNRNTRLTMNISFTQFELFSSFLVFFSLVSDAISPIISMEKKKKKKEFSNFITTRYSFQIIYFNDISALNASILVVISFVFAFVAN